MFALIIQKYTNSIINEFYSLLVLIFKFKFLNKNKYFESNYLFL